MSRPDNRQAPRQLADINPTVLLVADEWSAAHGGISTFNQRLAGALADADARVCCLVPSVSPDEQAQAAALGVRLIGARPMPGASRGIALVQKPELPPDTVPDVVLGHGRITGVHAKFLVENHFPGAARVHFIHVAPDEVECWRPDRYGDAGARADERVAVDLALCRGATRVVAVGPRLHERLVRDLHVVPGASVPLRFDPGFDPLGPVRRGPAPGRPTQVLLLGRTDDLWVKGIDLAARMVAAAADLSGQDPDDMELLVRGAPPGECDALRGRLRSLAERSGVHITVRPFTTDAVALQEDLARAQLVLMPSRAEGFGMAGSEAVATGVPTLVSGRSGLGMLMRDLLPPVEARRVVVPMTLHDEEDVRRWAARVAAVLGDPVGAFATAESVRRNLAEQRTWAGAAEQLLAAIPMPAAPFSPGDLVAARG